MKERGKLKIFGVICAGEKIQVQLLQVASIRVPADPLRYANAFSPNLLTTSSKFDEALTVTEKGIGPAVKHGPGNGSSAPPARKPSVLKWLLDTRLVQHRALERCDQLRKSIGLHTRATAVMA